MRELPQVAQLRIHPKAIMAVPVMTGAAQIRLAVVAEAEAQQDQMPLMALVALVALARRTQLPEFQLLMQAVVAEAAKAEIRVRVALAAAEPAQLITQPVGQLTRAEAAAERTAAVPAMVAQAL